MEDTTDEAWTAALTDVAGVPETRLDPALLPSLPRVTAPAPWTVTCDAVLWVTGTGRAAAQALPTPLRGGRPLAVVGAVVRYSVTPVGPYAEVLGALGGLQVGGLWASVPFMAVDSGASLVAGRTTWGLPKTLATLDGDPTTGTVTARGAAGREWTVAAAARPVGPAVPVPGRVTLRQAAAGSEVTSTVTARGRLRPAVVRVDVTSDGPLARWLRPGRHPGCVLTGVGVTIGEPHGRR